MDSSIIVQKFGGTSVADLERIRQVARHVKREYEQGFQVVAVVSAMAGVTNQLDGWAREISALQDSASQAEYDSVVSSGEQVTAGLLALTLQEMGLSARSWMGWQLGFYTSGRHMKARVDRIETEALRASLEAGEIAVVPGFQGITASRRITTLGRGGSDTSAVAVAAALKARRCDIYTDVDGVYSTDPRIVPKARKLHKVTYEEMLEMASSGAKVLQTRSVELAMNHGVRTEVRSTFSEERGTLLVEEDEIMEKQRVTGIAYSRDEARITLAGVTNEPGVAARIFGPLAEAEINVDMIVQNVTQDGRKTDMTFTVPKADLRQAQELVEGLRGEIACEAVHFDADVAKVSAIGVGMRSHAGVAQEMFRALAERGINILVISTSEIKISVLIEEEYTELAVRALHSAFDMDAEG